MESAGIQLVPRHHDRKLTSYRDGETKPPADRYRGEAQLWLLSNKTTAKNQAR